MSQDIKKNILNYMKREKQIEYTIPDIQTGLNISNREHVVVAFTELEMEGKVASRKKGKVKNYRIVD